MPTTFTLPVTSAATSGGTGVTLAQIEQALAPRVGPYRADTASGGTTTTLVCAALTSSIDQGGWKDLYLLRRGAAAADRVRQVKDYDPATGTLTVDRAWAAAPTNGEAFELHHLDPANELRAAVLAGLRRCYFVDRADVTLSGAAAERDLTALSSWVTDPGQVLGVGYSYAGTGTSYLPVDAWWKHLLTRNGHVWLATSPDPYPNTLLITSRRSHFTWVNGATSTTGPTADADVLDVDLQYAVAAAHIEAWRLFPSRLQAAAAEGQQIGRAEAAAEFTAQARLHYRPPMPAIAFEEPFSVSPWAARSSLS